MFMFPNNVLVQKFRQCYKCNFQGNYIVDEEWGFSPDNPRYLHINDDDSIIVWKVCTREK